ncbi:MAG: VOC family protein [Parvibaculum sp.]|nr:VOC family protein [Parvibaculum sp.]
MRLRQIALVAHDLEPLATALHATLGLNVAFRDPGVAVFGLVNVVMPVGGEFLEIVQPVRDDASAARYLKRRNGDAGYMVILQDKDALAHRARLLAAGVRKIAEHEGRYTFTHFHPGDFDGVLTSIDSVGNVADHLVSDSDWPPAGPDWRAHLSPANVLGLPAVTIQSRDPEAAAKRWAAHLASSVSGKTSVTLTKGEIRFVPPVDADGTGVIGIDIAVRDAAPVLAAAKTHGLTVSGHGFRICGINISLVSEFAG